MTQNSQPNVVVFVSHDTGRHVSPYGVQTVQTPAFERLAAQSVRFANAFSTTPQCSPARCALFSGQYPHAVGVMGNVGTDKGWTFPEGSRHAARIFGEAGYQTWLVGLQHESYRPETLGFDAIDGPRGMSALDLAGPLRARIEARDPARPFFCQLGCHETHRPWERMAAPPDDSLGVTVPGYLHDGPLTRDDLAHFQGLVRRMDTGLGRVLDVLDETGAAGDTILIVTTDHGIPFPRAKGTLLGSGIGVFLFGRWPGGGWTGGAAREELVSHVDVLPTLLDACGIGVEAQMQGRSLAPLLSGGPFDAADGIFAEKTHFHFYDPMRCVRTRRYSYIRNFEFGRQTETPLDSVRSGAMEELRNRYAGGHPAEELYDLAEDPDELTSVVEDEAYAGVRQDLSRRLAEWMTETDDPLRRAPIPSPFYARQIAEMFGKSRRQESGDRRQESR